VIHGNLAHSKSAFLFESNPRGGVPRDIRRVFPNQFDGFRVLADMRSVVQEKTNDSCGCGWKDMPHESRIAKCMQDARTPASRGEAS
jgi:hypothetical protein